MPVYCSDILGTSEALVRVREPREAYKYDKCNTHENHGGHKSRRHDTASSGGGSWLPHAVRTLKSWGIMGNTAD